MATSFCGQLVVVLPTPLLLTFGPLMQMREDGLPGKEVLMTTQEMLAFIRRGYDAYNAHQSDAHWLDYATQDMAENGEVVDVPSGMILRGPEGLKQFLSSFAAALPESRVEVTSMMATDEGAAVEFIVRGIHGGVLHTPAGDIPPTGRSVELHCCDVYQLREGKISRHASYYDALGFMQQLGLIPGPGQAR